MNDYNAWRYLTLTEARALECNGCGSCCDSRVHSTDGELHFGWGAIPKHQYKGMNKGAPLIIPLEQVGPSAQGRPWRDGDQRKATSAKGFACSQLQPEENGKRLCGLHGQRRLQPCGQFPVWYPYLEKLLAQGGCEPTRTQGMEQCTWYAVVLVPDDWDVLPYRRTDNTLDWDALAEYDQRTVSDIWTAVPQ